MELAFSNNQSSVEFDENFLTKIEELIIASLEHEGITTEAEVSLTFVDNEEIRELNRDYRGKDSVTDVLSFPQFDSFEKQFEELILGDIVISLERTKEQAVEYGHTFERELCYLIVHSMFHLMGYDHDNAENTKKMREKEEIVLSKFGITR